MGKRSATMVRFPSATLLIWVASLTLGLADVLYARLVPGPPAVVDRIALALACVSGLVFLTAAVRGLACYRACPPAARRLLGVRDAVAREAEWGIVQLEEWLRQQGHHGHRQDHSHDG